MLAEVEAHQADAERAFGVAVGLGDGRERRGEGVEEASIGTMNREGVFGAGGKHDVRGAEKRRRARDRSGACDDRGEQLTRLIDAAAVDEHGREHAADRGVERVTREPVATDGRSDSPRSPDAASACPSAPRRRGCDRSCSVARRSGPTASAKRPRSSSEIPTSEAPYGSLGASAAARWA